MHSCGSVHSVQAVTLLSVTKEDGSTVQHYRHLCGLLAACRTVKAGRCCIRLDDKHTLLLLQGVTDGWAAQRDWVMPDGGVNTEFLDRSFGDSNVMATDTSRCLAAFASFLAPAAIGADQPPTDSCTWHQLT